MRSTTWRGLILVGLLVGVGVLPVIALAASSDGRAPAAGQGRPSHSARPTKPPKATPSPSPTSTPTPSPSPSPTPTPTASPTPTPTPTPGGVVLVGAGDIASCSSSGDEATANLLDGIAGTVFTAGDNVYDSGTATEYANCYNPTWGRHLARTKPVPGNHEYNTPGATGYYGYFGAAAGDSLKGYYAYNLGAWRIYALNSNCSAVGGCGAGSTEEQWLRADLAANPHACVLAYWHHPRFSSGEHGSDATYQPFWQALYDFGAEIVVSGHDHDYERFAPQTPTGAAAPNGIVEIIAGTGGRSHYTFSTIRANSLVRNGTTYGVLKLDLSSTGYSFNFVPVAGQTFTDTGSGTCH
ncbi:MAG: metallophosphoesterase [Chloroflexota bacterium]